MKSKVYFIREINSSNLIRIYDALGIELKGRVAVKISTGEMGGHNYLNPQLIKPLVDKLNGTIVECGTAYGGSREDPKLHWETIKNHGFLDIARVDIMDEFGEFEIPVVKGKHLKEDIVGEHMKNYDSMLILSHFKGHIMGGYGGAMKNMSIGVASSNGKANIHSVGNIKIAPLEKWDFDHEAFLESMADACKAVMDYMGRRNLAYVSVANRLSVDCDCDDNPAEPEMGDLGIFASLDPVALDHACYDAVKNSKDPGKAALIERMDSRHAIHTAETGAELGLGYMEYELVEL